MLSRINSPFAATQKLTSHTKPETGMAAQATHTTGCVVFLQNPCHRPFSLSGTRAPALHTFSSRRALLFHAHYQTISTAFFFRREVCTATIAHRIHAYTGTRALAWHTLSGAQLLNCDGEMPQTRTNPHTNAQTAPLFRTRCNLTELVTRSRNSLPDALTFFSVLSLPFPSTPGDTEQCQSISDATLFVSLSPPSAGLSAAEIALLTRSGSNGSVVLSFQRRVFNTADAQEPM